MFTTDPCSNQGLLLIIGVDFFQPGAGIVGGAIERSKIFIDVGMLNFDVGYNLNVVFDDVRRLDVRSVTSVDKNWVVGLDGVVIDNQIDILYEWVDISHVSWLKINSI